MTEFTLHTVDSAPEGSKPLLEDSLKSFGMIPNLHAVMAASPQVLDAYKSLSSLVSAASLSPTERTIVWQTINVEHRCHYCVPAHTFIAKSEKIDDAIIDAVREERPIDDARLERLRQFTLSVVRNRGLVDAAETETFLAAGFTQQNLLDVILITSHKILSNYINHFADTPVDAPFAAHAWAPREAVPAE